MSVVNYYKPFHEPFVMLLDQTEDYESQQYSRHTEDREQQPRIQLLLLCPPVSFTVRMSKLMTNNFKDSKCYAEIKH